MIYNPFFYYRGSCSHLKSATINDIRAALQQSPPNVLHHFMAAARSHPRKYDISTDQLPISFSFHRAALETYLWHKNRREDYTAIIHAHLTSAHTEPHHIKDIAQDVADGATNLDSSEGWVQFRYEMEETKELIGIFQRILSGRQPWDTKKAVLESIPILFEPVRVHLHWADEDRGKEVTKELCTMAVDYLGDQAPPDSHAALVLDFFEATQRDERYGADVQAQSARLLALDCLWTDSLKERAQTLLGTPKSSRKIAPASRIVQSMPKSLRIKPS